MKKLFLLLTLYTVTKVSAQTGFTCSTARVIASVPYTDFYTTCGAGNDYSSASACEAGYNSGDDVVYSFTPSVTQQYYISVSAFQATYPSLAVRNSCSFSSAC